jgi:replicative DNA helicase
MVSDAAGVNYTRLINKGDDGRFRDSEWTKINTAYEEMEKMKLFVQDSSGVTIDEIESTVRNLEREHGKVSCVVVDYLQIMGINEKRGENRSSAIGRVTRRAKNIARNRKCVFIMLSQLDRQVDEGEPKMKHLKESGSIEQDADVIEALYDTGDRDNGVKIIDSIFLKGRNVGLNRFRYRFEFWYQRFVPYKKKEDEATENKG